MQKETPPTPMVKVSFKKQARMLYILIRDYSFRNNLLYTSLLLLYLYDIINYFSFQSHKHRVLLYLSVCWLSRKNEKNLWV
jgi:hypothetical protein